MEPILPELGISGITPFAFQQTRIGAESIAHSAPNSTSANPFENVEPLLEISLKICLRTAHPSL